MFPGYGLRLVGGLDEVQGVGSKIHGKETKEIFVNQKQVGHENSVGWFLVFHVSILIILVTLIISYPDYIVPYHLFFKKMGGSFGKGIFPTGTPS